jgi:preprotein translocase subunit YajC
MLQSSVRSLWLLAQEAAGETGGAAGDAAGNPAGGAGAGGGGGGGGLFGGFGMLPSLLLIGLAFYFLLIRPQQRQQRDHKRLLSNLKKNDRVVTVGGIYGVVTNVRNDADEVTIKVDEASNTKLRITLASIARVLREAEGEETPAK